jgi:TonB family protein
MSLLLASTIKVSLVILVGLGAATLLRGRSAAIRHWVLAAAILCAAAVPALELVVPAWGYGFSSIAHRPQAASAGAGISSPDAGAAEQIEFTVSASPQTGARAARPGISGLIVPAWTLGAAISVLLLVVGLARLTWLASRARPVQPGIWTRLADEIAREYGLRRPVRLLESDHPSLLVTWGLVQPKVIIPRAAQDWSADRAAIVLRHELAHIRRGDWLVQIAGELLRSAYWFNPLLWMACTRLRQESEQACDDEVLTGGVEGEEYATQLLELARVLKAEAAPYLPAPAVTRSSDLERRIRAMLDTRLVRKPPARSARFVAAAAVVVVTVAVAAAQVGPAKLSGSVVDSTGAPVAGATVVLTNPQSQAKHEVTTDQAGQFDFVPLPADNYVLEAKLPGFKKIEQTVRLAGSSVRRNLTLALGSLEETITVKAGQSLRGAVVGGATMKYTVTKIDAPGATPQADTERYRQAFERDVKACASSPTGGRVRPPRKIKDVRPVYPAHLQEQKIAGKVVMQGTVGVDGMFREVHVVESVHPELDAAAIDAVKQWQFDGTLLNCAPVEVAVKITVNFSAE